jgi:uncharacterized protein
VSDISKQAAEQTGQRKGQVDNFIVPGARYIELDALRGFAVMGILAMNIVGFALPGNAYMNPDMAGGSTGADLLSWFFGFIFIDGKMRGLFSLLFGASLFLVTSLAEAKGQSPAKTHYSRMFWLGFFGLIHFFFLWFGDILFLYAAIGSIAYLFRNSTAESLIKKAVAIYVGGFVMWAFLMATIFVFQSQVEIPGADIAMVEAYQEMLDGMGFTSAAIAKDVALYQSGFVDIANHKLTTMTFQPLYSIFQAGLETLPFMMLGIAMMKNGFFLGKLSHEAYRKWALWMILTGTILSTALALLAYYSEFEPVLLINITIAWTLPTRMMMTIGYAALLIVLIQQYSHHWLIRRVAAAGRAAFTNYLGTSVIMCAIFYGWGFGLYGEINRSMLWLFVIGMWCVMLLWSQPWLMRNRYGPLEWLWRTLSRGQVQPLAIR